MFNQPRRIVPVAVLGSVLAGWAGVAAAATLTVDDNSACPGASFTTIQAAVNASANGDTIDVCPGTYTAFGVPAGRSNLTIRSTGGPGVTFVQGYANGCYGILVGAGAGTTTSGITIEGFDIAPRATAANGCDWAGIAAKTGVRHDFLTLRNNVVHDVMQPGFRSCSGGYGIFGFGLNNVHNALIEGNRFHDMNNVGCPSGVPAPANGMTPWSSAVQVIFASGADSGYGPDPITIRNNVIESAQGFNVLGIRVKRSSNFVITGNTIEGLVATDGTVNPSRSRALHPQGQAPATPMPANPGTISGNTLSGDFGIIYEATDGTQMTGNDLTGVTLTHALFSNADNNFVCQNQLNSAANFAISDATTVPPTPSIGNTFPGGGGFPGNFECNREPSADAGGPYTVECGGGTTDVGLDGTGSSDPDGDPLTWAWTTDCPGATFDDATSATPTLTVPSDPGCAIACSVTLVVSDGELDDDDVASVDIDDSTVPVIHTDTREVACMPPSSVDPNLLPPTVTDVCDANPTLLFPPTSHPAEPAACPYLWDIRRTWDAHDECQNPASADDHILIRDGQPTLVGVPADAQACCDAVPAPAPVTGVACDQASLPVAFSETSGSGRCAYDINRHWSVTSRCGGFSATGDQVVHVVDRRPPTVTASLEPLAPRPPATACDPASRQFRVVCEGSDACGGAVALRAELTAQHFDPTDPKPRTCVQRRDTAPVACGSVVWVHLVPPQCPAKPVPARRSFEYNRDGTIKVVRGEAINLRVYGRDECNNEWYDDNNPVCDTPDCDVLPAPPSSCCSLLVRPAPPKCKEPVCASASCPTLPPPGPLPTCP